jgi:hypothetical protein
MKIRVFIDFNKFHAIFIIIIIETAHILMIGMRWLHVRNVILIRSISGCVIELVSVVETRHGLVKNGI